MAFQNRHDPSDALTYGELKAGTKDKRSGFFRTLWHTLVLKALWLKFILVRSGDAQ